MEFDIVNENWEKYKDYDSEDLGLELFNSIKLLIYNKLDYNDIDYNEYELLNDDETLSDFYANEIILEDIPALEDLEKCFEGFPDLINDLIDLILEQFEININSYYEELSGNDDYNDDDFDLESIAVSILLDDVEDICYDFALTFLDNLEIII